MKFMLLSFFCLLWLAAFPQDKEPKFKGKLKCYMKDIAYPYEAVKNEAEGTVYIQFEISPQGKVQQVVIQEGVSPILDSVARQHIANMPDWKPGLKNGKRATYTLVVPISYGLSDLSDKRLGRAQHAFEQGKALYYAGAYKDALPYLIQAVKFDPHFADAYLVRGLCHYKIGIPMAACMDLTKAQSMGLQNERSQNILKELDCERVLKKE